MSALTRTLLLAIGLATSITSAAEPELRVVKPRRTNGKVLSLMTGELKSDTSGSVIHQLHGKLGDCPTCLRGFSFREKLEIRFEGQKTDELNILVHTKTADTKVKKCERVKKLREREFECHFESKDGAYVLSAWAR